MKQNERLKLAIVICTLALPLSLPSQARTIYVDDDAPADFSTIQAAIDDANNGDAVIIRPGTYTGPGNRDIRIAYKGVTVQSVDPNDPDIVAATVIDCQGTESDPRNGFRLYSSNKLDSVISGLTITNGYAINGGAIYCYDYASPTIRNCRLIGNHAMRGGGLYIGYGTPIVQNCVILSNSVSSPSYRGEGGGIYCDSSRTPIIISGCAVVGNSASGSGVELGAGGGIYMTIYAGSVEHCTIVGNSAETAGGIYCDAYGGSTIIDCIVRSNRAGQDAQIGGGSSVSYSNVEGGCPGMGNIDAHPLFVNPVSGDYHLAAGSPCIDAGDAQYVPYPGQTDCDNEPRVMGSRTDMGADEFTASPTGVLNVYPKEFVFHADVNGLSPQPQVLHIENAGFAPLAWTASEDCPWLNTREPAEAVEGLSLSVDVSGLAPGRYDCEEIVTADAVPNSPQTVAVSLYVRAGRYLHVPQPYSTIQSAIEAAQDGDSVVIATGTYTGPGNRDIDLLGKAITVRSTDPNDPPVVAATIIDCGGTSAEPHRGLAFHHGEDANTVLAGLTITGGLLSNGAGVYVDSSSPQILRCNIIGNTCPSSGSGAGIFVRLGGPSIRQCLVANNRCDGSGARGGGIYSTGDPIIVGSSIRSNRARSDGGGMFSEGGSLTLSNCVVVDNEARSGGGIGLLGTIAALDHSLVADNRASDIGGGMYSRSTEMAIRDCTIAGNVTGRAGGGLCFSLGMVSLTNTILWGDTAPDGPEIAIYTWDGIEDNRGDSYPLTGVVDVLACDIEGGQPKVYIYGDQRCLQFNWSVGNIDADPLFAKPRYSDPNEAPSRGTRGLAGSSADAPWDYHLKSQAGRWEPISQTWVIDDVTSPCIDAGDPNSAVGDEPEPNGGRVNMGAYGGTAEASKSYRGR